MVKSLVSSQFHTKCYLISNLFWVLFTGLANGEIHVLDGRTTWGARVRYKCKQDYSLVKGPSERTCQENGWSGDVPECVYTKCPELPIVENSDVTIIGEKPNYLGSKVIYRCKEGYKPSGSLSRECLEGGKWSGMPPKCEFLDCGNPPNVTHANAELIDGRTFNHLFLCKGIL